MDDKQIINLFWNKSEIAILELDKKYRKICKAVAFHILRNEQDVQECVNDSYLAIWNTIPPKRPENLSSYICRIVRNLSLKRYRYNTALKRNGYFDEVLDELEGYIVPQNIVEAGVLEKEIVAGINEYLGEIKKKDRVIFVKRYWFCLTPQEIAKEMGVSNNYVNVSLHRTKKQMEKNLKGKGLL